MMDILDKLDTIFALAILMSTDMGHTDTLETLYTLDILDIIDMLDTSDTQDIWTNWTHSIPRYTK